MSRPPAEGQASHRGRRDRAVPQLVHARQTRHARVDTSHHGRGSCAPAAGAPHLRGGSDCLAARMRSWTGLERRRDADMDAGPELKDEWPLGLGLCLDEPVAPAFFPQNPQKPPSSLPPPPHTHTCTHTAHLLHTNLYPIIPPNHAHTHTHTHTMPGLGCGKPGKAWRPATSRGGLGRRLSFGGRAWRP